MEVDGEGNPMNPKHVTIDGEAKGKEVSYNAILGTPTSATMKLSGKLHGHEVLLLIDSGSTHNFISEKLVEQLKLHVSSVQTFGVQVGDDFIIQCDQICKSVSVKLPGSTLTQDFYPFPLTHSDMVLGIKWLASLNTIQANWNEMFLIFWVDGKRYKLQGISKVDQSSRLNSMVCRELQLGVEEQSPLNLNDLMQHQHLDFHLEDKVSFREGSNDKIRISRPP